MRSNFTQPADGRGCIRLTDSNVGIDVIAQCDGFKLQRAADRKYLNGATSQWDSQLSIVKIVPKIEGNTAILDLPPSLINVMKEDTYKLDLMKGNDTVDTTRFSVKNVRWGDGKIPEPQKKPEPVPPSVQQTAVAAPIPAVEKTATPPSLDADSAPQKKTKVPLIAICAAALLIAAALAAYFLLGNKDKLTQAPSSDESKQQVSKAAVPMAETPIAPPQMSYREQVRLFFANKDRSPEKAIELANGLKPQTAEDEDTLFRLYYFAASKDNKAAYVPYAKYFDPTLPQTGSIKKDARTAWDYYSKGGDSEALSKLKAWLEKEAASGNDRAKAILEKVRK